MRYEIFVKPGSKKGPLVEETAEGLTVFIPEKAHDGEANAALVKLLAKHFKVSKSQIEIIRGNHSHHKLVEVTE